MITQKELKEILYYDPETGIFFKEKYIKKERTNIMINRNVYELSRLAWLYVYGYLPENRLLHINKNKLDNRIKNLKESSRSCCAKNRKLNSNNTSGVTGVSYHINKKNWTVTIYNNKKKINIFGIKDFNDAVKSRWELEKEYNYPECNSSSLAYKYLKEHGII